MSEVLLSILTVETTVSQRQVMGFCGTVNLHTDFLAVKSQIADMPNLVLHDSWVDITNRNVHSVYLLSQHHTVATQLSKQGRRQVLNVSAETHSSV